MQFSCPSAIALSKLLQEKSIETQDLALLFVDQEHGIEFLKSLGIDLANCDMDQLLAICRQCLQDVQDDELVGVSGGEVKFAAIVGVTVGSFAAATITGGILAATIVTD